jgi:hypothetical protein
MGAGVEGGGPYTINRTDPAPLYLSVVLDLSVGVFGR